MYYILLLSDALTETMIRALNIIRTTFFILSSIIILGVDGEPTELCYRIVRPAHHSTSPNNKHGENPTTAQKNFSDSKSTIVDRAICYSLRHEKSVVESIRKGVDCGIVLVSPEVQDIYSENQNLSAKNFISQWKVGDIIQCYVTINEKSSVDWDF